MARVVASNSELASYFTCPRKWWLEQNGVEPVRVSRALNFGRLFHRAVEGYGLAIMAGAEKKRVLEDARKMMHDTACEALMVLKASGIEDLDEQVLKLQGTVEDVLDAIERYLEYWYFQDTTKWDFLDVERRGQVVIPTENGHPSHFHFRFIRDKVVRDKATGQVFLWDTKTTSERHACDWVSGLEFDGQARGYTYAYEQLLGKSIDGIIYDVVRSKRPAACVPLKSGQTSHDGQKVPKGMVSVKRTPDTTLARFCQALRDTGIDPDMPGQSRPWAGIIRTLSAQEIAGTWMHRQLWMVTAEEKAEWLAGIQAKRYRYGRAPYFQVESACNIPSRVCPYRRWCRRRATLENPATGYTVSGEVARYAVKATVTAKDDNQDDGPFPF